MSSVNTSINGAHTRVSGGVGTTVLKDQAAILHRVIIPGTYVGTIQFDDAATSAGTVASSQILALGLPALEHPRTIEVGVATKYGLLYRATGTPVVTIIWE